jgi:spermidine synthase
VGVLAFVVIAAGFDIDPRRAASGVFRTGNARLNPKSVVLYHRDGKTATVDVLGSDNDFRAIRTNGKSDASITMREGGTPSRDEFTMTLLGMLPMGHNPGAKNAAIIGFGSGMSTSVMLGSPKIEHVDTIEIEPAMIEGAKLFRPYVDRAFDDPRSRVVIDDAKSFFARGKAKYDIIVSEPSNPWVSGVSSLFTEEFYRRLSTYLNEGGVLSQWLHTYEMDTQTLASIMAAVSKTFPEFVVYSSIDSDIILVARKGGPPGPFDASVMQYPGLKPLLTKLKMTEPQLVRRRAIGHWGSLEPFIGTYGIQANSDYFPLVDQRTSKTRFTQARADELTQLEAAPIPLLEMFDGAVHPETTGVEIYPVTYVDHAGNEALLLRDAIMGLRKPPAEPFASPAEFNASVVRHWAVDCPAEMAFERMLPLLTFVAERMSPHLPPREALRVWAWLDQSKCGKALLPAERKWMLLFGAVAMRDAQEMAATGTALLEQRKNQRGDATEYAYLAALTGVTCQGETDKGRALLRNGPQDWLRGEAHPTELRFLSAQLRFGRKCPGAQHP